MAQRASAAIVTTKPKKERARHRESEREMINKLFEAISGERDAAHLSKCT